MEFFITAFLLGFTYSPHCAGMCGPIALAFPINKSSAFRKMGIILLYNSGRIITYGILGLVFGFFGRGIQLAGFQQIVSIALGVIIIAVAVFPVLLKPGSYLSHLLKKYTDTISMAFVRHLGTANVFSYIIIGLLNGLLPCGLVYLALAASLMAGNIIDSALYMVFFGIGTIPVLSIIIFFKASLQFIIQKKLRKIIPWLTILIGILFILRGLNLGIKYISPKQEMLKPAKKIESGPPPCCR